MEYYFGDPWEERDDAAYYEPEEIVFEGIVLDQTDKAYLLDTIRYGRFWAAKSQTTLYKDGTISMTDFALYGRKCLPTAEDMFS